MKKHIYAALLFIFLLVPFYGSANAETYNLIKLLKQKDEELKFILTQIGESRKILNDYLTGYLDEKEAEAKINSLKSKLNSQNISSESGDGKKYIYKAAEALISNAALFISSGKCDDRNELAAFLKKQTEDSYEIMKTAAEEEKKILTENHASDAQIEMDYAAWRQKAVPISEKQRNVSLETELFLIDSQFSPDQTRTAKRIKSIVKQAETIGEELDNLKIPLSMKPILEASSDGWKAFVALLKAMEASANGDENQNMEKAMKDYREAAERAQQKITNFIKLTP